MVALFGLLTDNKCVDTFIENCDFFKFENNKAVYKFEDED